jgi:hypothetical protein
LTAPGTYYWRAKNVDNSSAESAWSVARQIIITSGGSTSLDAAGCAGLDLAFGSLPPPASTTTTSSCTLNFDATGGISRIRVAQTDAAGRAMTGAGTVLDYGEAGGTWAGTSLFGACLLSYANATNTWSSPGTCPTSDGAQWNDIPTAADQIATAADGITGTINLRYGLKVPASHPPGAHAAGITIDVISP